jgi:hypothetical protein
MIARKIVKWSDKYILGDNWYIVKSDKPHIIIFYGERPIKSIYVKRTITVPRATDVNKSTDKDIEEHILNVLF